MTRNHGVPANLLEARLQRDLEAARYAGFRGGFIPRHRALLFSPLGAWKIAGAVALSAAGISLWVALLGLVSRFWSAALSASAAVLNLAGAVVVQERYAVSGTWGFDVPMLNLPAGLPSRWMWLLGMAACTAAAGLSWVLPQRALPLAFALRIVIVIQLVSQAIFAFVPDSFPYSATGYLHTMLLSSLVLIGLVPVVLGLSYYLLDFTLRQKLALTTMVMGHLTVLIPLQYAAHAFVLYHLSLLFLPVLFFAAALPLNVLIFIAFYGWAFSWDNPVRDRQVQWRIRGGWQPESGPLPWVDEANGVKDLARPV